MTELEKFKESFRKSKKWENFRKVKYAESSKDFITHKRLKNRYNLHHLDLNPDHYDDLSHPEYFENLNSDTHSIVHKLYPLYRKDPRVLERLQDLLDRMVDINS